MAENDPLPTTDHAPSPTDSAAEAPTCPHQPTPAARPGDGTAPALSGLPSIPGYELEAVLGRGGMGVVFKARHLALKRTVALKMIRAGDLADPGELARFQVEAQAVARLQHPNIVQIYEVGTVEGSPYCALELAEGGSLAQRLAARPLAAREAARLVEALAQAMHLAHSRNVVHRDLKPANVLLMADGTPKITDFGLARHLDRDSGQTQAGQVMGTPSYMAPEQALGRSHDAGPAADVYALGALLYACLTGRPPFVGQTMVETLDLVRTQEPVPPSRIQAGVPLDLETICLKCLRKEPEKRYASAAELADDLVRYQRGEPIQARPVGPAERLVKWVRRNRVVASLLGLVVAALVAGGTGIYVKYLDAETQRQLAETNARQARTEADEKEKALRKEQSARRELEEQLANGKVQLAQAAWDKGEPAVAREVLGQVPEPLRRWEWRYLRRAFEGGIFSLYGHTAHVHAVAFSADGSRLATAGRDRTARLWDARTGAALLVLRGHTQMVQAVAFSPDGTRLATASGWDGTARVWDTRTGAALLTLRGITGVTQAVAFSPDGKCLAAGYRDLTARLWDVRTGASVRAFKGHTAEIIAVAFNADGTRLATVAADRTARLWDARTGAALHEVKGHRGLVQAVAFSPDGRLLATGSQDNTVRLWDVRTGASLREIRGHPMMVIGLAFSPDGTRLATGCPDRFVRLWDVRTGALLRRFQGHTGPVFGVGFSPDGARLASAGGDGTARLWDVRSAAAPLVFQGHTVDVAAVAFSPEGASLATAGHDGAARTWDARTGLALREFRRGTSAVQAVAFSGDGTRLASADSEGAVRLWDARTGTLLRQLEGHTRAVLGVAFSPDGARLASAGEDQTARLWDIRTGATLRTLRGHAGAVSAVAFSTDGARLATASKDGTARLWDAQTGALVGELKGHTAALLGTAFSVDGSLLATAAADQTARLWDGRTGAALRELRGHTGVVAGVAFSPDGSRLATASWDKTARLWDARTGAALLELRGHTAWVRGVAFSPDGSRLATASSDRTARLWDGRLGVAVVELKGHAFTVVDVAFSPDGTRLWTWDTTKRGITWDLATGGALPQAAPLPPVHEPRLLDGCLSSDGRRLALLDGSVVRVVDVSPPGADELAARRWANRPDPFWHLDEAERLLGEGQATGAAFHLGQAVGLPGTVAWLLRRGEVAARLGRWRRAQADFAAAWKQQPESVWLGRSVALAQLAGGQTREYGQTCAELRHRFGVPAEVGVAGALFAFPPGQMSGAILAPVLAREACSRPRGLARALVARTCVLSARDAGELPGLLRMGDYDPLARAAVLCRLGRQAEAVRTLAGSGGAVALLWRARAECGQGRFDAARRACDQAEQWLAAPGDATHSNGEQLPWEAWLEVRLLRKEIAACLGDRGGAWR